MNGNEIGVCEEVESVELRAKAEVTLGKGTLIARDRVLTSYEDKSAKGKDKDDTRGEKKVEYLKGKGD